MAFPQTTLPVSVHIGPGSNPADPTSYAFTEITPDARVATGIQIQQGRQDEGARVDASSCQLTLDNKAGNYSTRNPLGTWYGQLAKGTPLQVRVTTMNDQFTRTVGSGLGTDADSGLVWASTSAFSVNGSAALCAFAAANTASASYVSGTGGDDVVITHISSLSAVTTGAAWVDATILRQADVNNFYRLHTEFGTSGTIGCKIVRVAGGVSTDLTSVVDTGVAYSAGTQITTKVRAVGATLQIRAWLTSGSEPTTWTCSVTDTLTTVNGVIPGLYEWRVAGNTNIGTLTCTIDQYKVDVVRSTTPVPEWPIRWNQPQTNVTAPIAGAGILRRLGNGQDPVKSPIYRQLAGLNPQAYLSLEDASGASVAASAVPNRPPGTFGDASFGSNDCPAGASSAMTLNTQGSSQVTARVSVWTIPTDGYATMVYARMPTLPVSSSPVVAQRLLEVSASGTISRWVVYGTSTGWYIEGYQADGTLTVNTGSFAYGIDPTKWFAIQLEASESGPTVTWALIWYQVGASTFTSGSGTYTGTSDFLKSTTVFAPVAGTLVSHLWLGDDTLPFVDGTFIAVSTGYAGETAAARLARLSNEQGVPVRVYGDPTLSAPMGVQTADTFLNLARECEDADQGTLFETGGALGYRCRNTYYNQTPAMVLDFNTGHIAGTPEPTDDDQQLKNRITLTRKGGSSVTVQSDASIAVNDVHPDTPTANLQADYLLADHAGWRLSLGTADDVRWPRIQLKLHANPSLIGAWCAVRVGSRITIANPPAQAGVNGLDLIVEGWTERLSLFTWDVELVCSPAAPWQVAIYDDAERFDSGTTVLQPTIASNVATFAVLTSDSGDVWSWLGTDLPYDLLVGGERMTALTMSRPSSVAVVDGGFETGSIGTWSATGGTLAASNAQANRGSWSALLTVSGSPTTALIRDHTTVAVSPGQSFTTRMFVRCSISTNVTAVIDYYNGASYLSSSLNAVAVTANTWTEITASGTAPASTTRLEYGPSLGGSPANGTTLYIDDIEILRTDFTSGRQLATVTRAVNGVSKAQTAGAAVHVATPGRYAL